MGQLHKAFQRYVYDAYANDEFETPVIHIADEIDIVGGIGDDGKVAVELINAPTLIDRKFGGLAIQETLDALYNVDITTIIDGSSELTLQFISQGKMIIWTDATGTRSTYINNEGRSFPDTDVNWDVPVNLSDGEPSNIEQQIQDIKDIYGEE